MKNTFFIFLLSIVSALIYTADDSELQKKNLKFAIKAFEEIYDNEMQKAEDYRIKQMTIEDVDPPLDCRKNINVSNCCTKFWTLLDNCGKTVRGEIINKDQNVFKSATSILINNRGIQIDTEKNAPRCKTFYKKIDIFNLRESPQYSLVLENKTITKKIPLNTIAKLTSCMLLALKSENIISFSESGPYEITLTHNLPDILIHNYQNDECINLGYLNNNVKPFAVSPGIHLTLNAKLPTTLQKMELAGFLSDYALENVPQHLEVIISGRHNILDTSRVLLKKPIYLSGIANTIIYNKENPTPEIDPKCRVFTLNSEAD